MSKKEVLYLLSTFPSKHRAHLLNGGGKLQRACVRVDQTTDHHHRRVVSRILRHSNSIDPERRTDKQTTCCIGMVLVAACGGARRGWGRGWER